MSTPTPVVRDHEWYAYYDKFPYFSKSLVRDGCQPRIFEHQNTPENAIVLVNGLTDSPFFLTALARFFHQKLGYNVYLPLLHMHGLKEPNGMEGTSLEEWHKNVSYAVEVAASRCNSVSIGGLSTGGTLSFFQSVTDERINGNLFLFSAALDLKGVIGDVKERLLIYFASMLPDADEPLIGENPFRYSRMDVDGATQLARLIVKTDRILKKAKREPLEISVFAAHSECDQTADIRGIERLSGVIPSDQFRFFRIPESVGVSHASLVLETSVAIAQPDGSVKELEASNPIFSQMLTEIETWLS